MEVFSTPETRQLRHRGHCHERLFVGLANVDVVGCLKVRVDLRQNREERTRHLSLADIGAEHGLGVVPKVPKTWVLVMLIW